MSKAKYYVLILFLFFQFNVQYSSVLGQTNSVSVIFDTDMGPMIDDVGALAMLHALSDNGEAEILATIASNTHPDIARVIDVFNTYYGRPNIPIGVPKGPAVEISDTPGFNIFGGWTRYLVNNYPATIRSNEVAADAVKLVRRILSKQPDNSVTIITVGFLTNLADLLASGEDEYSNLNGVELVERKVIRLVAMAGIFPSGHEYNLNMDTRASMIAFEHWPTEIIFSGFEIGRNVRSGMAIVNNDEINNSPVREAFRMKLDGDRSSFDQTAVLVAVRGVNPFYELEQGRITIELDGRNGWDSSGEGHYYLVEKMDPSEVGEIIDELIQQQPKLRSW